MIKRYHLLGASSGPVAILFDLLNEVDEFVFYPNQESILPPPMPIQVFTVELRQKGDAPPASAPVFLATPGPKNKRIIFNYFRQEHGIMENRYDRIVSEAAYVAGSSYLETGVLLEPSVTISSQVNIGFCVSIKRNTSVGHHSVVGAFTDINPGVTICGNVTIGSGCTIGAGSSIRDRVTIGENTTIGMGSVVLTDIPANCIAYGNPCKVIREIPKQ